MACSSNFWYLLYLVIGVLFGILLMAYGKRARLEFHVSIQVRDIGVQADRTNYEGLTIIGLQSELRYRGMKVTGLKEDLVKRATNGSINWNQ